MGSSSAHKRARARVPTYIVCPHTYVAVPASRPTVVTEAASIGADEFADKYSPMASYPIAINYNRKFTTVKLITVSTAR